MVGAVVMVMVTVMEVVVVLVVVGSKQTTTMLANMGILPIKAQLQWSWGPWGSHPSVTIVTNRVM
jgi:hypothetical protein